LVKKGRVISDSARLKMGWLLYALFRMRLPCLSFLAPGSHFVFRFIIKSWACASITKRPCRMRKHEKMISMEKYERVLNGNLNNLKLIIPPPDIMN